MKCMYNPNMSLLISYLLLKITQQDFQSVTLRPLQDITTGIHYHTHLYMRQQNSFSMHIHTVHEQYRNSTYILYTSMQYAITMILNVPCNAVLMAVDFNVDDDFVPPISTEIRLVTSSKSRSLVRELSMPPIDGMFASPRRRK